MMWMRNYPTVTLCHWGNESVHWNIREEMMKRLFKYDFFLYVYLLAPRHFEGWALEKLCHIFTTYLTVNKRESHSEWEGETWGQDHC